MVFLCPNERERERERARARVGKGKREREREKARTIIFLNRLGQSENSANYTVLYGKSGIVCS